ncbi:uncharacterized protein LOC110616042 isoform X2 [Manihot esculenta]|uniref:Uncharacterized protein n=1 Tax=Manihot esculenta TaxID=3983 RepID=A0A2C9VW22_MANES|nr:uncharacterized protein LOC110616042 isoform X2 [Manihot esculenta]OAY50454.1 hypothetical protein MANES_05G137300v8 [Manihot esculenta]
MNSCAYQRKSAMGSYEERTIMEVDSMVCPKPRRLGLSNPSLLHQFRPIRLPINSHQTDMEDSMAGAELLDIILTKGGYGGERSGYQVASSPPFYCGSPPSRASNPVVQDAQFGNEITPFSPAPLSPSSSSARKGGGCVRMKFGHKPAATRIEGFDCLSRDRRNCSISAVA